MNDPTKPIPRPLHSDMPARRRGESERLAFSAGSGKGVSRSFGGVSGFAYGGNAATSRAEDRATLLELASKHSAKARVHGVGNEVREAWSAYCAAVDRIVV